MHMILNIYIKCTPLAKCLPSISDFYVSRPRHDKKVKLRQKLTSSTVFPTISEGGFGVRAGVVLREPGVLQNKR